MNKKVRDFVKAWFPRVIPWAVLVVGLYFVVIRWFGPNLNLVPGDLGDARFNNFVLENFLQWCTGRINNFWDAPIFYPNPNTIAFSDSLLGSAPFYALLRLAGLDRESAFQGWYVIGFVLNYLAAAFVLNRLKLHPLAISAGSFLFTFGLPVLAQAGHAQLFYRFGIPLACYYAWDFSQRPKLKALTLTVFWFAWQFALSIYLGFFLSLLLIPLLALFPLTETRGKFKLYLLFWPAKLKQAWSNAGGSQRTWNSLGMLAFSAGLVAMIAPYIRAASQYGFHRQWFEIVTMLPSWKSYLLADRSLIWAPVSHLIQNQTMRHEQQLFPGITAAVLILIGLFWKTPNRNRLFAFINLWAVGFLVLFTFSLNGHSIYQLVFSLPGFNSIRAVSRIILSMLWPLSVFIAMVLHQLIVSPARKVIFTSFAIVIICLMVVESTLFAPMTYSKSVGVERLVALQAKLPADLPPDAILAFNTNNNEAWYLTELDAMLLGQESGFAIMNGYSGNFPAGYGDPLSSCKQIRRRISAYLNLTNTVSEKNYARLAKRVIPIGLTDCGSK